jgi:ABC-type uncharacterized transport system ATPase subunit
MIHQGRKVLDEPMAGLSRQYDTRTIRLEPLDPAADVSVLRGLPGVEHVNGDGDGCEIRLQEGTDPVAAIRSVTAIVAPARIEVARLRLEDVFIRLVTQGDGGSAQALRANLQGLTTEGAAV